MQRRALVRAVAARLLVVAFALRAIVPVGFMPDLQALNDGRIEIVICTGAGPQTIEVDANGKPIKPDSSDRSSVDCPFALTFAKAVLASFTGGSEIARLAGIEPFRPAGEVVPLSPSQGPPLGSRAPPFLIG